MSTASSRAAWALACAAAALLLPVCARAEGSSNLADHLLVVYNTASPSGAALARYYAKARSIPEERLLGISCPTDEEISRAQYREIEKAIRRYVTEKHWLGPPTVPSGPKTFTATENKIWCIVLIQGVPLKIANDPSLDEPPTKLPALNTNAASVDSELALLPTAGMPLNGPISNPYFSFMGSHPFDDLDARQMVMVGRLDGPAEADVRRMIDDALDAETHRLSGRAYVDARGLDKKNAYYTGDAWLLEGAGKLADAGWETAVDRREEIYPENLPWRDVAIYGGWYAEKASGPFLRDTAPPVFARGAIAYHLHSFSASTLRSATSNWCGPLIAHGAAATMGCVYEPYLDLTPHWNVFIDRLVTGASFIEAAYASEKGLSWMTTFVGDPLYRPFKLPLDQALTESGIPPATRDFFRLQWIRREMHDGRLHEASASLKSLAADPTLTAVGWEGCGDLWAASPERAADALNAYAQAAEKAPTVEDEIRVRSKEIVLDTHRRRMAEAEHLIADLQSRHPVEASYFDVAKLAPAPDLAPVGEAAADATKNPAPAPAPAPPPAPRPPTPMVLKPAVSSPSAKPTKGMPPAMP